MPKTKASNRFDTTPKPRVYLEKIGKTEYELHEEQLDVFDDVVLWDENPRLLAYLQAGNFASEEELEAALQRTRGYNELRRSIEELGQIEPVYVWRREDTGKFLVFEGATRVAILRDLARKHKNKPKEGMFLRVRAKILPPHFTEAERVILLARIHVRGTGVRAWGRYIEAKFIYDNVHRDDHKSVMSVTDMANHMEKSTSWVCRLRDAYEFAKKFEEHVDSNEAAEQAINEFSTLEEISKAAVIGPKLRDYSNTEFDALRGDVFDMVKNRAFKEYRDARFMKDFYEDPEKWALLKSGEPEIASKLASEVKTTSNSVKARIAALPLQVERALQREDHGLHEDDVKLLKEAISHINEDVYGVPAFHITMRDITSALNEASLADIKKLTEDQVGAFREAVEYVETLISRRARASA